MMGKVQMERGDLFPSAAGNPDEHGSAIENNLQKKFLENKLEMMIRRESKFMRGRK
jgi:hypothetical protein